MTVGDVGDDMTLSHAPDPSDVESVAAHNAQNNSVASSSSVAVPASNESSAAVSELPAGSTGTVQLRQNDIAADDSRGVVVEVVDEPSESDGVEVQLVDEDAEIDAAEIMDAPVTDAVIEVSNPHIAQEETPIVVVDTEQAGDIEDETAVLVVEESADDDSPAVLQMVDEATE